MVESPQVYVYGNLLSSAKCRSYRLDFGYGTALANPVPVGRGNLILILILTGTMGDYDYSVILYKL